MALIDINKVHFTYTGRKAPTLDGVSLSVHEGETVLLLGPSGSGKSTLALCLNGLIPHTNLGTLRGGVTIAGYEAHATAIATLSQQVGMVFQDPAAQLVMRTVEEEVAFGLENVCVPQEDMEPRITLALAQIGLDEVRHAPVESLSGGYQQRLAIACALAMRPRILVFDEPSANLDPIGTRDVFAAIKSLKHLGTYTIVLIEHKLDDVLEIIDRVVVLSAGGKVLLEGAPHAVFGEHMEWLIEQGVWVPQVALLAHRLHTLGWTFDPYPVTLNEAIAACKHVPPRTAFLPNQPPPVPPLPTHNGIDTLGEQDQAVLSVQHLSFQIGTRKILDDISLCVPRGDFLAILGANGAGKTTLAYHLANIMRPPRGTVMLNGRDIARFSPGELLQEVGYVFQNPEHQFVTNSVQEELRFGLHRSGLSEEEITQRVEDIQAQFGLRRYTRSHPLTLSHGEKRRLSVATMLVREQQLLILDEPTFGQDQRNASSLLDLLQKLHRAGQTILIITHDMSLVAEYARHVAVLIQGRLCYHGPTAQLFSQTDLLRQAHLELPVVARLAQHLTRTGDLRWRESLTCDQFVAAFKASKTSEEPSLS